MTLDLTRQVMNISTHAPAGGATNCTAAPVLHGRISTHAPAGGATSRSSKPFQTSSIFLLTPLREGRPQPAAAIAAALGRFLLTPLREGRLHLRGERQPCENDFYSRPCGRGDL